MEDKMKRLADSLTVINGICVWLVLIFTLALGFYSIFGGRT